MSTVSTEGNGNIPAQCPRQAAEEKGLLRFQLKKQEQQEPNAFSNAVMALRSQQQANN